MVLLSGWEDEAKDIFHLCAEIEAVPRSHQTISLKTGSSLKPRLWLGRPRDRVASGPSMKASCILARRRRCQHLPYGMSRGRDLCRGHGSPMHAKNAKQGRAMCMPLRGVLCGREPSLTCKASATQACRGADSYRTRGIAEAIPLTQVDLPVSHAFELNVISLDDISLAADEVLVWLAIDLSHEPKQFSSRSYCAKHLNLIYERLEAE